MSILTLIDDDYDADDDNFAKKAYSPDDVMILKHHGQYYKYVSKQCSLLTNHYQKSTPKAIDSQIGLQIGHICQALHTDWRQQ